MRLIRPLAAAALLTAGLLAAPGAARAETYHTCAGFIDTLPATISTQGVWCLRKDVATNITSGAAITIATQNVTIDCNGFKIGGLSAGTGTITSGVYSLDKLNSAVRNCNIRGFFYGVDFGGAGSGHTVEDNRFEGNTHTGIYVWGDGSVIRNNRIFDTGGSTNPGLARAIYAYGTIGIAGNSISNVLPTPSGGVANAYGIYTINNFTGVISGNEVRGLAGAGAGFAYGIYNFASEMLTISGNVVIGDGSTNTVGIRCNNTGQARAIGNVVNGFTTANTDCVDAGGNSF